jgi:hypothetical protein
MLTDAEMIARYLPVGMVLSKA